MLPIVLAPSDTPILLFGQGRALQQRLRLCKEAGLAHRLLANPSAPDFTGAKVVLLAGLSDADSQHWAQTAKQAGALVNVEDKPNLCDFYMPALLRRGDLLLAVSTQGKVPALASALRDYLAKIFPAVWSKRVQSLADLREEARSKGASFAQVREQIANELTGWLK